MENLQDTSRNFSRDSKGDHQTGIYTIISFTTGKMLRFGVLKVGILKALKFDSTAKDTYRNYSRVSSQDSFGCLPIF